MTWQSRSRPRCYRDSGGLTLEQALTVHAAESNPPDASDKSALAEYHRMVTLAISRRGNRRPITPALQRELALYRRPYTARLIERLQAGDLVARGVLTDSTALIRIAPAWWTDAQLDLDANSATAHGVTVWGIEIFAKDEFANEERRHAKSRAPLVSRPVPKSPPRRRADKPTLEDVYHWTLERAQREQGPIRLDTLIADRPKRVSGRAVQAVYPKLPEALRFKPGRPWPK